MSADDELLQSLRQISGEAQVVCKGDLTAWEQDWRKRLRG